METALVKSTRQIFEAREFLELEDATREELRRDLACAACGADAYYVRPSRNGRPACFGARPHNEPCDVASQTTEKVTVESLTAGEQRAARTDGFTLRGADARPILHTVLDDPPVDSNKPGRTYTEGGGGARGSRPGLKLNRLLRLLVVKPDVADAPTPLQLANGTQTTFREYIVPMGRVDRTHRDRERVYWGTIRYAKATEDGAWLNTGSRSEPTIRISNAALSQVLDFWELDEAEDLSGAAFAFWGRLRLGKRTPRKWFLFADSLVTFAVIPEQRIEA